MMVQALTHCTVRAKYCLLDPLAPLHLSNAHDIGDNIPQNHLRHWIPAEEVVKQGAERGKTAKVGPLTKSLPRSQNIVQNLHPPRMTRGMLAREHEQLHKHTAAQKKYQPKKGLCGYVGIQEGRNPWGSARGMPQVSTEATDALTGLR